MDFDLSDLISSDVASNAKVNTKFQPKAKARPKPKPKTQPEPKSTPTPSTHTVESAAATDTEFISGIEEDRPGNDVNQISTNDNQQTSFVNSQEENVESFLILESLNNDCLPESTTVTANSLPCSETPGISLSMHENLEKGSIEYDMNNKSDDCTNLESFPQIDPLTGEEAAIFNDNEDFTIGSLSLGLKDAESWEPIDTSSQQRTYSGPKVCKFKPKPKAQTNKVEHGAAIPNQEVPPVQYGEDIHTFSSQTDYIDDEPVPSFTPDEILGPSSIGVTDSVPTTIDDFHANEEPINFEEISQLESAIPTKLSSKSVKKGKRQTNKVLSPTQQVQSVEPSMENQGGSRSSERLRKRTNQTFELVDEGEDEGTNDDFVHEKENNMDGDFGPENESLSERKGSKSKKSTNVKEKPIRKRKKVSEVPVEPTKVKKRFPHGTRRNKRQVNPELLKIPEDELEFHMHNVPMKELIRLAEHRERIAKKEASTLGTPVVNQSANSFSNHHDNDEAFAQGMGSGYVHDYLEAENATYYNYRTHMKIAKRIKWTKQDTELFYEAVQQFGTDLSMIAECFPGRTREQIKSKFKKEERQQPLRLNDALTTRFKGHSHFEVVIERLKQAQAEESEDDDPMNLVDDEAVTTNINEAVDATKSVRLEKEVKDTDLDVEEAVGSPAKPHDSGDDMYRWSQYKSEI